jgi:hypothetical protein
MRHVSNNAGMFWQFMYKRALGMTMITFAIILAVGVIFTVLINSVSSYNYTADIAFWGLLIAITIIALIINFANAHKATVKYMSMEEHARHSVNMGIWTASITVGIVVFSLPMIFFSAFYVPIIFLLTFGGIMWVIYISTIAIFRNYYHEIAIGASALWIAFVIGGIEFSFAYTNVYLANFILLSTMAVIILVFGIVGGAMMFNAHKSIKDGYEKFVLAPKTLHSASGSTRASARRKRNVKKRRRR